MLHGQVVRSGMEVVSLDVTYGPESSFGGMSAATIADEMISFDENGDGKLDRTELGAFVRECLRRYAGGISEVLGFKLPTAKLAIAMALDLDGDGEVDLMRERFDPYDEGRTARYLEGRFKAGRALHKRIIRTQQTAKLQGTAEDELLELAARTLEMPPFVGGQVQVLLSRPDEHYGAHDDGSFRIFTSFFYCQTPDAGGATAFPYAIPPNPNNSAAQEHARIIDYRTRYGMGHDIIQTAHLSEYCVFEQDCCDPRCAMMTYYPQTHECVDDPRSLTNCGIEAQTCEEVAEFCNEKPTESNQDLLNALHELCPQTCGTCEMISKRPKICERIVPGTGTVAAAPTRGTQAVWPNYEIRPDGKIAELMEAGHCACPPYGKTDKWAANVWFMIPIHYLRLAMMAIVREFVSSASYASEPPSRADEVDTTLRQLDRALQAIDAVEERFRRSRIFGARRERRCTSAEQLMRAPVEALLFEALQMDEMAFGAKTRQVWHYKMQFEYSDGAKAIGSGMSTRLPALLRDEDDNDGRGETHAERSSRSSLRCTDYVNPLPTQTELIQTHTHNPAQHARSTHTHARTHARTTLCAASDRVVSMRSIHSVLALSAKREGRF